MANLIELTKKGSTRSLISGRSTTKNNDKNGVRSIHHKLQARPDLQARRGSLPEINTTKIPAVITERQDMGNTNSQTVKNNKMKFKRHSILEEYENQ